MEASTGSELFKPGLLIAGRYEIVRVLGAGAVGTVVQVIDHKLDREVCALKVIFPQTSDDPVEFGRFRNEVLLCRTLSHPNIVRVYDFGEIGSGFYYISMEYVAGGSLGQRIYSRQRKLDFEDITRILYQICQGLAVAHDQGVVHRDLKPDNILLSETDQVKVSDFGLARSLTIDRGFTNSGETVGTPYYMAPEQLRGEKPAPSIDIYSLGILAFELAVGRRPFVETNYMLLAAMHMREQLPYLATEETGLPDWYEQFVHTCAAKDKSDRFLSAYEAGNFLFEHMGEGIDREFRRLPMLHSFTLEAKPKKVKSGQKLKRLAFGLCVSLLLVFVLGLTVRNVSPLRALLAPLLIDTKLNSSERAGVLARLLGMSWSGADFFPAIEQGDKQALAVLLAAGCDANAENPRGETPLLLAVRGGEVEVLKLLLGYGAAPDRLGPSGAPLHLAAAEGNAKLVDELRAKADPSASDQRGRTPLMHAVSGGDTDVINLLLGASRSIDAQDRDGKTALLLAVEKEQRAIGVQLLEQGADINLADYQGNTPLIIAAAGNSAELTKLLLDRGADPARKNLAGKNAGDLAQGQNKELLEDRGRTREMYVVRGDERRAVDQQLRASSRSDTPPTEQTVVSIKGQPELKTFWDGITQRHQIKVAVINRGEFPARDVKVLLEIPGRSPVVFTPAAEYGELKRKRILILEGVVDEIASSKLDRLQFSASCSNCTR